MTGKDRLVCPVSVILLIALAVLMIVAGVFFPLPIILEVCVDFIMLLYLAIIIGLWWVDTHPIEINLEGCGLGEQDL